MELFDPALPARFWDKVQPEPNSGCWIWLGATNNFGYGQIYKDGKIVLAHRWSKGFPLMEEDHKCRVPSCVNPAHLETVTHKENLRRGRAVEATKARGASITHCKHGHEFTPENTYIDPKRGTRSCKTCHNELRRVRRLRRKANGT